MLSEDRIVDIIFNLAPVKMVTSEEEMKHMENRPDRNHTDIEVNHLLEKLEPPIYTCLF